ncbi:unnamed protein product, partial [Brassica oleracea]
VTSPQSSSEKDTAPVGAAIGLLAETESEIEEAKNKAASKSSSVPPVVPSPPPATSSPAPVISQFPFPVLLSRIANVYGSGRSILSYIRRRWVISPLLFLSYGTLTFPSNLALLERAARCLVIANEQQQNGSVSGEITTTSLEPSNLAFGF